MAHRKRKKNPAVDVPTTEPSLGAPDPQPATNLKVFKIRCAVLQSQGMKISQIQFQISSNVTLEELRTAVAEKLQWFPALVKLQYRLDCKAKTAFTSIQSDEALEMFIETVQPLIVAPCLANGKPLTRPMKPVIVYFDDTASDSEDTLAAPAPTGNHNKVVGRTPSHIIYYSS
ncbi:hypothetical protein OG21DRAFT_1490950 [Imleria badia]|nr:hypothetical protein OG21DRAFT_1490950 [Imleria badia]